MTRHLALFLLCLTAGLAGMLPLATFAEESITHREDIVYGRSYPDGAAPFDLMMDAYVPGKSDSSLRPALLFFHGNPGDAPYPDGRQHGFKSHAEYFAAHGYVVFVVAYPFFGDIEAKSAVRHVRANGQEYRVDPGKIAALGHSLGSNLSMRLAVTDEDDAAPNEKEKADPLNNWGTSARVNAAIPVGGGNGPHPTDDLDKDDSPLCFVHGTADDVAPIVNALERRRLVQDANIPNVFLRVEGLKHAVPAPSAVVAFGRTFGEFVDAFLRIHMHLQPPEDWAALHIIKSGGVDIVLEPEHGLYPKGQQVKVSAIPKNKGLMRNLLGSKTAPMTTTVTMDATKDLSFPFDASPPGLAAQP